MSTSLPPAVVITALGFAWPNGTTALHDITANFGRGRTGLTGRNGSGKSTLLRLIAGELAPTEGSVVASAAIGYLRQDLALAVDDTVAQALGIAERRAALAAVLAGHATAEDFETVGDDWDLEERAVEVLADLGMPTTSEVLDRALGTLSGGETVLIGLARLRLAGAAITLLDEPTNNLDRRARESLYAAVRSWKGALIVVSHDRELLDLMDETAELFQGGIRTFGGNFSAYEEQLRIEREAAERGIRSAEQELRIEKRQRIDAEVKLAHRARYAKTDYENKRMPKIVMNERKSEAQVSAGKHRTMRAA
ncbi:MAG: ATP-binding cassette domain-containing protein, partial [Rhodoglobus sp.]